MFADLFQITLAQQILELVALYHPNACQNLNLWSLPYERISKLKDLSDCWKFYRERKGKILAPKKTAWDVVDKSTDFML